MDSKPIKKRKIDMEQDEFFYIPLPTTFTLKLEESALYNRRKIKNKENYNSENLLKLK